MTAAEWTLFLGLTLAGFIASALFSGLETGAYVLNRVRLTVREAARDPAALRLRREFARPRHLLTVLLIGTNAANYLGSYGLAEILARSGLGDWMLILVQLLFFTPALFVFAETLPKELFRTNADRWMYALSPIIVIARHIATWTGLLPVVEVVSALVARLFGRSEHAAATARQRMSQLLKEGVAAGVLSTSQTTLADRALALRDQRVRSVMVPWGRVTTVPATADGRRRRELARQGGFTRLPVVDAKGRVVGVLPWIEAILHPEAPIAELLRPALIVRPDQRVLEVMRTMRHEQRAIAIVQSPGSRHPAGVVTLKDLVEPLTGEIAGW